MARQRETAEGVVADFDAGLGPRAAGGERHHFAATLIDVMLESVGRDSGRRGHHVHIERFGGGGGAHIVRDGCDHDTRFAIVQGRHLFAPNCRCERHGRSVALNEETVGGSLDRGRRE